MGIDAYELMNRRAEAVPPGARGESTHHISWKSDTVPDAVLDRSSKPSRNAEPSYRFVPVGRDRESASYVKWFLP